MIIKDVRIRKVARPGNASLKAFCSVNFDDQFVIHGIRLIEGEKGFFLSFPSVVRKDKGFTDVAHPISSEFRDELTKAVAEAYANDETSVEEVQEITPE